MRKRVLKKYIIHIIAIFLMLLGGCTTSYKTPVGPVCRSCKPYYCRGTMYYPQKHYEYTKIGKASWYGNQFHGKKKANGEKFNKYALTAAHRTLPLPSVVKVTNLRNNKFVIVIVDDRGPYTYEGRIIDLSYGAARSLDLHRYKPSPVKVECMVEESLKLSHLLAKHKKNMKRRTWLDVYNQEIAKTHKITYYYTAEKTKKTSTKTKKETKKKNNKMIKILNLNNL